MVTNINEASLYLFNITETHLNIHISIYIKRNVTFNVNLCSVRTIHFNKDYTNFHDSPLPKAKLLHAYRKAHKFLRCTASFLLHSELDPRPYHAACIWYLPTEIWISVFACFCCCKPFYAPDVVSPFEAPDILVLTNAVFKEFVEIKHPTMCVQLPIIIHGFWILKVCVTWTR
jgi:hypothetical protein